MEKQCRCCGEVKPANTFTRSKKNKDGLHSYCRPCASRKVLENRRRLDAKNPERVERRRRRQRAYVLATRYGISVEEMGAQLKRQGGACAICSGNIKVRYVDHCHKTGRFRGVLCIFCNAGMGQFRESPVLLRRAADYLEEV